MFTIEEITKECEKICAAAGYSFDIPVVINGRLRTTLGRVMATRDVYGYVKPVQMEFSRSFLKSGHPEAIHQVIQHECAHYLVDVETHENHGHDAVFKAMCARIGCKNDKAALEDVWSNTNEEEQFKYLVYCDACNTKIQGYNRAGKVVRNIGDYVCPYCHKSALRVHQNW